MRAIIFNHKHTAEDWGLILTSKKRNPPTPKYTKVSVDGRDGEIDLSRALTGEIKYKNTNATYGFLVTNGTQAEREELVNEIINYIHGQKLNIIEPDDPNYYIVGDCIVDSVVSSKAYSSFNVSVDCEPYRYAIDEINRYISLSSAISDIVITNAGTKTLIPTLKVDGSVNIVVGSSSIALSSGAYKLTAFKLKPGATTISVSGSGTLTISYREAIL